MSTIVLDLDETLVHVCECFEIDESPSLDIVPGSFSFDLEDCVMWGVYRPGVKAFLTFVLKNFDNVVVWSAGVRSYVDAVVKRLFLDNGLPLPKIVWARDECRQTDDVYHKPISQLVHADRDQQFPIGIDQNHTLIVDDRPHTFMRNPRNGVLIPPFDPSDLTDRNDDTLAYLEAWLISVLESGKIFSDVDKSKIFDAEKE